MLLYIKSLIKRNIDVFSISFIFSLVLNILFLVPHYAIDSYNHLLIKNDNLSLLNSTSGRPLSDSIIVLTDILGLELVKNQTIYTLISIIVISLAITILVNVCLSIKNLDRNNIKIVSALCIACSLIFFNIFSSEMFIFSFMMPAVSFAYLSIIVAIYLIAKKDSLKNYIVSYILLSVSLFIYQALAPIFLSLVILLLGYKYREEKLNKIIIKLIPPTMVYGLACLSNLTYIKLVTPAGTRFNSTIDYMKNIQDILKWQYTIWIKSYNMMPKYIWMLIIVSILIFSISIVKDKLKSTSLFVLSILALEILCMLPHVFLSSIWIVPRTVSPLGGLPALIIVFAIIYTDNSDKYINLGMKFIKSMIIMVSIVFICFTTKSIYTTAISCIITNYTDNLEAKMIIKNIESYEKNTGIKVTKLAFKNDANVKWGYDNLYVYGDMNVRALIVVWARLGLIELATNRSFGIENFKDTVYNEHFRDKNWDYFDNEQIVIVNDTAYIIVY